MTTRFRLEAVSLNTSNGEVRYTLPSDLTVLAGPTGVGKTTLLELVKFGVGGEGLLAPVALQHVVTVILDVAVGQERYRLSRELDPQRRAAVRVDDLVTGDRLSDHRVDDQLPSLSSLLLAALGMPDDMRAAARTGSSANTGARITFNDVFTFMYVPQASINKDIASSQEMYREPKRRAVFELLFGLTNPAILEMRSRINFLNGELARVEQQYETVLTFLRDSGTADRRHVEEAVADAAVRQRDAEEERVRLRAGADPVTDRETQALRDLLNDTERRLTHARDTAFVLVRQQADYAEEKRRLEGDIARIRRMREAGERLASIEFSVCPRCTQTLSGRAVPGGACRLCLQPDPVAATANDTYETRQLEDQVTEIDAQLVAIEAQRADTSDAITSRQQLIADLSANLDRRTADRISPRLQAFDDVAERLAQARAEQEQLEAVLRQWDRADDIGAQVARLHIERDGLRAELDAAQGTLDERRREIIASLTDEFRDTVLTLGVPGVEDASIHPTNYLPLLNGRPFAQVSSGGGIITATQVAYWTSLLTVALRRRDTSYPAFLLVDSPRLALNTAEDLAAALYRRLVTQADANRGQLQIVIADNELPPAYRRDYDEIDFTYDQPTIATVRHPGPALVIAIVPPADDDDVE
ncbi:MAG: hypothetical protein QOI54_943 [Actinomycetota bacterium]|jgi:hypothetical protein|nr:hypothetical protein [Actinomycetota bacterium]